MSQPSRGVAAPGGAFAASLGGSTPSAAAGDTQVLTAGVGGGGGSAPLRLHLGATPEASAPASAPHADGATQLLPPAAPSAAPPRDAPPPAAIPPVPAASPPPPAAAPPAAPAAPAPALPGDAAAAAPPPPLEGPPEAPGPSGAARSGGPPAAEAAPLAIDADALACAARAVRRDFTRAGRGDAERAVRMTVTVAEVVAAKDAHVADDAPLGERSQDAVACAFMLARHDLRCALAAAGPRGRGARGGFETECSS
jgi:hypothetical protein